MHKLLIVLLGVIFLITPFCYSAWKFNPHTNKMDFYEDVETTGGWTHSGTNIYPTTITDNVGIGTTAPLGLLQVGTNPAKPGLLVLPNNNVGIGWTSPVGLLQVSTTPSSGLVVLPNGNVGIGTTNPARRLQVVGDYVRIGDGGTIFFVDGDGDLYVEDELEVNGVAKFLSNVDLSQTLTTTTTAVSTELGFPAAMYGLINWYDNSLYISTFTNNAFYNGNILFIQANDRNTDFGYGLVVDPHVYIQSSDATKPVQHIGFWHDQTNANIKTGSGKLIFTANSNPGDFLHIKASGTGANVALRISNTAPRDVLGILDNGNVGIATTAPMGLLQIGTSPGALLMVLNTGNVGIGTTLPTTPLTIIASNTAPANNLYLNGTAGARLIISQPDGGCSSCGVDAAGTTWACIDVTCP